MFLGLYHFCFEGMGLARVSCIMPVLQCNSSYISQFAVSPYPMILPLPSTANAASLIALNCFLTLQNATYKAASPVYGGGITSTLRTAYLINSKSGIPRASKFVRLEVTISSVHRTCMGREGWEGMAAPPDIFNTSPSLHCCNEHPVVC